MKIKTYSTLILSVYLTFASCYKDKGNYDYTEIEDIVIEGIADSYTKIALVDKLEITPQVITPYNESELEYTWLMYNKDNEIDTLSHEKNLSYLITEGVGSYMVYLYVKNKSNGFYRHTKTALTVGTEFSRGHYILKETADGNTDIDLLLDDARIITDIIERKYEKPLSGLPRSMGILYDRAMIDPDTDTKTNAHCLSIITYNKEAATFRASDMHLVFDYQGMFYEEPSGDTPYKFITSMSTEYYAHSGIYSLSISSSGSGYFGFPTGEEGGSDHWGFSTTLISLIYWDETNSRVLFNSGGGIVLTDEFFDLPDANHECLFMGSYQGDVYGLFRHKTTSNLQLYRFSVLSYGWDPYVADVIEISTDSKLHGATHIASNETSAEFLYFVNNNKLYYFDTNSGAEQEMTFSGLPADETITYVSNRHYYLEYPYFDYITVATHKNGKYNIYMYELLGGLPYGTPVKTASGNGKVKEIHYLGTSFESFNVALPAFYGWDFYPYGYSK